MNFFTFGIYRYATVLNDDAINFGLTTKINIQRITYEIILMADLFIIRKRIVKLLNA